MPWGVVVAAVGVGLARGSSSAAPAAEPPRTDCNGCGAPLRPHVMVCDHCQRSRRRAYALDARPGGIVHMPPSPAPAPLFDFTPTPSYSPPPAPAYEPPAPAPDFSSGGGGDFSGGGASGEF